MSIDFGKLLQGVFGKIDIGKSMLMPVVANAMAAAAQAAIEKNDAQAGVDAGHAALVTGLAQALVAVEIQAASNMIANMGTSSNPTQGQ